MQIFKNPLILISPKIAPFILCVVILMFIPVSKAQATLTFSGFPIPHNSYPMDITAGPDGNIWFTENWNNTIGRMSPDGVLTEFPLAINNKSLVSITTGPDGNLWYTYTPYYESKIGRITPSGSITEYLIPPLDSNNQLWDVTAGPDGNLWFTERQGSQIGRITPNGTITEFPLPTIGIPLYITSGPDGNLWFTEQDGKIGRITPEGVISEFPLPIKDTTPWDLTSGPDGNLWFTENAGSIGRITIDGKITEFSTNNPNQPFRITMGPDGNLWFTEILANKLGRITTQGVVTEFQIPDIFAQPWGRPDSITTGPDGNLWFTEFGGDMIGRINLSNPSPTPTPIPSPGTPCILSSFGDNNGNPFRQQDNQWKNLPYGGNYFTRSNGTKVFLPFKFYGNNKDTIGTWGCKTTSAAMIVNYYAKQQNVMDPATNNIFQTDPKKLNAWLQQNDGYSSGHALPAGNPTYWDSAYVDLVAVVKYAKNNGVNISNDGTLRKKGSENSSQFISRTKDKLNNSMCAYNPAILAVNNSGHFIDATGKAVDNAVETWQIHDPMWNGNPPALSTLKAKYSNIYNQIDLMSGNLPKKHLTVIKYSPIEMYITDPDGKKTGLNAATNTSYDEIPSASYGTEYLGADDGGGGLISAGVLDIVDPKEGDYALTVTGTGNGEYGLEARESGNDANFTSNKIFGTTTLGQTTTFVVASSSDSSEPVVLQTKIQIKVIPKKINPAAGVVAIGILGESGFNAKDIDISTIRLGSGKAKPLLNKGFIFDINKDNKKDLLVFFRTNQAGINQGDTKLCLSGSKGGALFKGCDEIEITQQIPSLLSYLLSLVVNIEPQDLLNIRQLLDSNK